MWFCRFRIVGVRDAVRRGQVADAERQRVRAALLGHGRLFPEAVPARGLGHLPQGLRDDGFAGLRSQRGCFPRFRAQPRLFRRQ